tara:strand:- start:3481 stop:3705 length:225 start_codon:yes stop_codon:yes gene_type:complete
VINNNIDQVIKSSGMTKKFICDNLGINYSVMSGFINGSRIPSQSRVKKLAKFLGVNVKALYPNAETKRITIYNL